MALSFDGVLLIIDYSFQNTNLTNFTNNQAVLLATEGLANFHKIETRTALFFKEKRHPETPLSQTLKESERNYLLDAL